MELWTYLRNISSSQYLEDDNEKLKIEIKKLQDLLDNKDIELKKVKSKENKEIIKF